MFLRTPVACHLCCPPFIKYLLNMLFSILNMWLPAGNDYIMSNNMGELRRPAICRRKILV